MKEGLHRQEAVQDRIVMRTTIGSEAETPIMDLPKNPIHYGARPETAANPNPSKVLPEGLNRLDLRTVTAGEVTMEGPEVGGKVVVNLNKEGIGSAELEDGREVVVYAAQLTERMRTEQLATGKRDGGLRTTHAWTGASSFSNGTPRISGGL